MEGRKSFHALERRFYSRRGGEGGHGAHASVSRSGGNSSARQVCASSPALGRYQVGLRRV
jgi:hypothetical protein